MGKIEPKNYIKWSLYKTVCQDYECPYLLDGRCVLEGPYYCPHATTGKDINQ